jgi:hypothetical protein
MMGYAAPRPPWREDPPQEKLFCVNVSLEKRIRPNHPLRQVAQLIDFDFVYKEVEDSYGTNGHVSVPPPDYLKADVIARLLQSETVTTRASQSGIH